jgi:hypothetical protein
VGELVFGQGRERERLPRDHRGHRHFGTAPEFCVNLQSAYDLEMAKATLADRVNAEVSPRAAYAFSVTFSLHVGRACSPVYP